MSLVSVRLLLWCRRHRAALVLVTYRLEQPELQVAPPRPLPKPGRAPK